MTSTGTESTKRPLRLGKRSWLIRMPLLMTKFNVSKVSVRSQVILPPPSRSFFFLQLITSSHLLFLDLTQLEQLDCRTMARSSSTSCTFPPNTGPSRPSKPADALVVSSTSSVTSSSKSLSTLTHSTETTVSLPKSPTMRSAHLFLSFLSRSIPD